LARSSCSARSQSASGDPPWHPRASQYENARRATASWKDTAAAATGATSGSDLGALEISTLAGRAIRLTDLRRAGAAAALETTTLFSEPCFLAIVICFLKTGLFLFILNDRPLHSYQNFLSFELRMGVFVREDRHKSRSVCGVPRTSVRGFRRTYPMGVYLR
jgi:hypothetical protein